MTGIRTILALGLILAGPLAAQRPPGGDPHRPEAPLVQHRRALDLSDAQVERLTEVARRLEASNRPLRQRLHETREAFVAERRRTLAAMSPAQRQREVRRMRARGRAELPPEMRALVEEMRGNTRRAMGEIQAVLTPEQKRRARQLLREHRAARARGQHPGPPRPRARDGR